MISKSRKRSRRGNAAVVGLCLGSLLGFGALSVDVAVQRVANAQVQAAIEAAVLGGAGYLDRTIAGMYEAKTQAVELAGSNPVLGGWSITEADVAVGVWEDGVFTEIDPATLVVGDPLVMRVNAVRIDTVHDSITTILASAVFEHEGLSSTNAAIAVREPNRGRARSVPCYLPLAIPDCIYDPWLSGANTTTNPDPIKFVMSNANVDNVGWADPFSADFGTDDIKSGFSNEGCKADDLEVGENMHVKNGQNTSVLQMLGQVLSNQHNSVEPTTWDHAIADRPARDGNGANCEKGQLYVGEWPNGACDSGNGNDGSSLNDQAWAAEPVIQGPVALVTPPACDATSFTGTMPVSGFAWAMIYDVSDGASDKNIFVQLDFLNEHDLGGDIDDGAEGNITGLAKPKLINL